jgi:4-amino-4-deoxy-L-arabinose transferase-like glycosyltransferase
MTDELAARDEDEAPSPPVSVAAGARVAPSEPGSGPPTRDPNGAVGQRVAPGSEAPGARSGAWLVGAAWCLAVASFFVPIATSGIWDPHELSVADLARRIAVTLLGASHLTLEGSVNTLPTAGELGRGELPFTSVAVGFAVFGLSDWAGRLLLGLWGLAGCAATFLLIARLADRVAASFAVIVLATTPLYFLHARTILGDVVTMSALAVGTAGLALAVFDDRAGGRARAAYWVLGALGLAAGMGSRGVLIGAALPTLAVAGAWGLGRSPADARAMTLSGVAVGVLAAIALGLGLYALETASEERFSRLVGTALRPPRKLPTHDFVVLHLGHALFPWSAVIPFAMGRLLRVPKREGAAALRDTRLRLVCALAAVLGVGAYGWLARDVGLVAFGPVFALAAMVAIVLRDLERGAPGSRALAIGVGALAILFYTDFKNFPDKGLSAFAVEGAKFPDSFAPTATAIVKYGAVLMAVAFFGAIMDGPAPRARPFDRGPYVAWWRAFRESYAGNLQFSFFFLEALLVGFAALTFASDRHFHWAFIETLSTPLRQVARFGWIALPLLVVAPWGALLFRDAVRAGFRVLPITRGSAALASVAIFGAVLSFWYYPALAAQISPKGVFSSYRSLAGDREELAMVGTSTGAAAYYAGGRVTTFQTAHQAFEWLVEDEGQRRWLVVKSTDLPALNASYRERFHRNLPVLDGRSSEILLVSNELRQGEASQNPFSDWVLDERPQPQHRLDVDFGGQLRAIGWAITTRAGDPVDFVTAGKPYQVRLYYEVEKPVVGEWKTFIHIDGFQRRYNGDHDTLQGKYPMRNFRVGDFIVDVHDFELEPNFGPGDYELFFGFFTGSRRLEVKQGAHDDNRVRAGAVQVR